MTRQRMPMSEAALLSGANARIYCGQLGKERFERVVGPHVTPRLIGKEKFYLRSQLDAWAGLDDSPASDEQFETILDKMRQRNGRRKSQRRSPGNLEG